MSEAKFLIMNTLIAGAILGVAVFLPRIVQRVAFLKKNVSEVAVGVTQGLLILYALVGAINPVLRSVGISLV